MVFFLLWVLCARVWRGINFLKEKRKIFTRSRSLIYFSGRVDENNDFSLRYYNC